MTNRRLKVVNKIINNRLINEDYWEKFLETINKFKNIKLVKKKKGDSKKNRSPS